MSGQETPPGGELILYQAEDGRTRIQCRFEGETIWLTQALIAELFQKDVRTINEHLTNIFGQGELGREAIIRKFRIVRLEGGREVAREIEHYNLDHRRGQNQSGAGVRALPEVSGFAASTGGRRF